MKVEEIVLPDPMEIPTESIAPVITRLSSLQTALAARLIGTSTDFYQGDSLLEGEDELLTMMRYWLRLRRETAPGSGAGHSSRLP
jgi:hypothetical protein